MAAVHAMTDHPRCAAARVLLSLLLPTLANSSVGHANCDAIPHSAVTELAVLHSCQLLKSRLRVCPCPPAGHA